MWDLPGLHLVTNGDQTRTLRDVLSRNGSFEEALAMREREPDAPHYTPRIAGLLDLRGDPGLALGILKASAADPALTDRFAYRFASHGLVHLTALIKLQFLNLQSTKVTDAGLVHLKGMTKLQTLILNGTKVTAAGIKKLKAAMPKCFISWTPKQK